MACGSSGSGQSEEAWPGPVRASDGAGEVAEGAVALAVMLEAVHGDGNHVGAPAPLADETRARRERDWPRRGSGRVGVRGVSVSARFRQVAQAALRSFGEAAVGEFLGAVGEGAHE